MARSQKIQKRSGDGAGFNEVGGRKEIGGNKKQVKSGLSEENELEVILYSAPRESSTISMKEDPSFSSQSGSQIEDQQFEPKDNS